jgi:hypothetical protein
MKVAQEMESAMYRKWPNTLEIRNARAATSLPPATVDEAGWDILLALTRRSSSGNLMSLELIARFQRMIAVGPDTSRPF